MNDRPIKNKLDSPTKNSLGISTMLSNSVSGAFSMFSGKNEHNLPNSLKTNSNSNIMEENKENIVEKEKEDLSDPKIAEIHLLSSLKENNSKIKKMLDKQISKWKFIQYKREKEEELNRKIK